MLWPWINSLSLTHTLSLCILFCPIISTALWKWATRLENNLSKSSSVHSLFTFSQEGTLSSVSMETRDSQSGVFACWSHDPQPVERCIEFGHWVACWLRFIERKKHESLRRKSSLEPIKRRRENFVNHRSLAFTHWKSKGSWFPFI